VSFKVERLHDMGPWAWSGDSGFDPMSALSVDYLRQADDTVGAAGRRAENEPMCIGDKISGQAERLPADSAANFDIAGIEVSR
jgi:hypothetical protein